jgi:hypothetical protein
MATIIMCCRTCQSAGCGTGHVSRRAFGREEWLAKTAGEGATANGEFSLAPSTTQVELGIWRQYSSFLMRHSGRRGPLYSAIHCPGCSSVRAYSPRPQSLGDTKLHAFMGPNADAVSIAAVLAAAATSIWRCPMGLGAGRGGPGRSSKAQVSLSQQKSLRIQMAGLRQSHSGGSTGDGGIS